jgi:hypothetical protein
VRVYYSRVGPKTNDWCLYKKRGGHTKAQKTQEEGHVTREAEIEVVCLQVKEPEGLLATPKGGKKQGSVLL